MSAAESFAPKPVTDFGDALRKLREQAGFTQEQLAERAGLGTQTVGAYERGDRRAPRRDTLALIIEALGLTVAARDELAAAADRARWRRPITTDALVDDEPQRHNLPLARTALVGRDDAVAEVKHLLSRHRLLTITGSGGIGKTRLAIQAGAELVDRYPDGVWFVDLAPIRDPELVTSVVAQALRVSQRQGHPVSEAIPLWLQRKKLLVVLDNCEHVLDSTAALADAVLTSAPNVRILATSRQTLGIGGEAVYRIRSLDVPVQTVGLRRHDALQYSAIALFVDRASTADTGFTLTDEMAPIVADICKRLDGIALAIELAAVRVSILSIPTLSRRLNERFSILTGGTRDAPSRQKTLKALLDWSYDLLEPRERLLLARLGIFSGGAGPDAVMAVCEGDGLNAAEIFALLESLADKSLVIADTSGQRERYRLLESTAAYALEKLTASGERERMTRRHAEHFRKWAQMHSRPGEALTIALLSDAEVEIGNFRAAMDWALTGGRDAALGGAIAGSLSPLWVHCGLAAEGRYWVQLALPLVSETEHPTIAARLQLTLGFLSTGERRYESAQHSARLYASADDARSASLARRIAAEGLYQMGRIDESAAYIEQVLLDCRELGDTAGVSFCLNQLASIPQRHSDFSTERKLFSQALAGLTCLGDNPGAAVVLGNLAELEFAAGDPAQALRLLDDALALMSLEKPAVRALWRSNSAAYRIALGDALGAREAACEALRLDRQDHRELGPWALQHLALIEALHGDARCAARLLGYVDVRYDELSMQREPTEKWSHDKLIAVLREHLSEEAIGALAAEGAVWSEDRALAEALDL